jgi:hypothetical protein
VVTWVGGKKMPPQNEIETRVEKVIVVTFRRGEGKSVEDPVRSVTAYYSLKGELLAESDPYLPGSVVVGVER